MHRENLHNAADSIDYRRPAAGAVGTVKPPIGGALVVLAHQERADGHWIVLLVDGVELAHSGPHATLELAREARASMRDKIDRKFPGTRMPVEAKA